MPFGLLRRVDGRGPGLYGAPMDLGPNVTTLQQGDRTVYIVGTAHISEKSVREVRETIEAVQPDTVCVELCKTRFDALQDEDRWEKLDIFQVIRQGKGLYLMSSLALSAYQQRLGQKLGVRPGAELQEAVAAAKDVNAELVLADRDISATLKRTWANLSFFNKLKVLGVLMGTSFSQEEITEAELEQLKDKDHISEAMESFAQAMPQVKEPLIDERDQYLMSAVDDAPGKTVVAVVGAGHVSGMIKQQGQRADRAALSEIPPSSKVFKSLKWIIPILILAAFYYGWQHRDPMDLYEMVMAWLIPNSVAAALFSAIAGAKLISVVTAFIASPITSLNPTIGAGMVVGLVEAWLRKPTVADAKSLGEDMQTFRGMRKNAISRVLLVALAATLGSAVGAWIGGLWILTIL